MPEYKIICEPNYLLIGKSIDDQIIKHFSDGNYIIRAIGKDDHINLSLEELVSIILKTGTDKYDPKRKSVCHEEFSSYDYDIQGDLFKISKSKIIPNELEEVNSLFGQIVYDFYNKTLYDRGYPIRIDLLLIYKADQLIQAKKIINKTAGVSHKLEKYLFKFKHEESKRSALLGIIKILR